MWARIRLWNVRVCSVAGRIPAKLPEQRRHLSSTMDRQGRMKAVPAPHGRGRNCAHRCALCRVRGDLRGAVDYDRPTLFCHRHRAVSQCARRRMPSMRRTPFFAAYGQVPSGLGECEHTARRSCPGTHLRPGKLRLVARELGTGLGACRRSGETTSSFLLAHALGLLRLGRPPCCRPG